jgi:type VI secretion system protein ImpL
MKRALIGVLIFVVYLACVIAAAFALHFSGTRFALFCIVLGVLGGATIAFAVWYMSRVSGDSAQAGGSDSINLDALLRDADRKLRSSRLGVKSLAAAQIIYIVGEDNSAKTQTVLQSGLDAELLAGNLFRDGVVAPTQLANIWLAGSSVIVEAGGSLLQQPALWQRLIKATRPGKLGSLFAKAASQPPRAVVVCVSAERVPGPSEAGYNANQIRASAQTLNERLRQLSQTLGISVPVYVLFTKLDTLPHFADYIGRLSADEVKAPLGSIVAQVETGSGLYAERASALVSTRLDELTYALSEFRLEVLSRGGELKMLASAYEFPRDLQKRRATLVDFLVELARPSQLGINPFLRGFFFSGMRALIVEEAMAAPVQRQANTPGILEGATSVFSIGGAQMQQPQPQLVRTGSRKVPQWAFLPHLFSTLLLSDKSALEASRASTSVNLLKRALLACVCSCIFVYIVLLTISFINNRDLLQQVNGAAAVSVYRPVPNQFASAHDLQTLDQLGAILLKLDSYRKDGPPLMDRWGLYSGDELYPIACNAYSIKFQALLLGPTQSNILTQLRAVQLPPAADADYGATYNPLAAYLITTSNPEKSTTDFLPPALLTAWRAASTPPPDLVSLAQTQFQTYAHFRTDPQSCLSAITRPDVDAVAHAREYLKAFDVYESMLAAANRKFPSIRFNDNFPGSVHYVADNYEVKGAFTKSGFAVIQDNIQHLDKYFAGEKWVLDQQAGPAGTNALSAELESRYIAAYIAAWRSYLTAAHFVDFQNWKDADTRLSVLDSPSSPILQLFSLISINTGVDQPQIMKAFQAPQAVVPPNSPPDRFKAPSTDSYMNALVNLATAVKQLNQNSLTGNDPSAAAPVQNAATQADQEAVKLRNNAFQPDPEGKMDSTSLSRLEDPINSIFQVAAGQAKRAPNGAGAAFCSVANNVLNKFPFNRNARVEASPDDVAGIFAPLQGALAKFTASQNQLIVFTNGRWVSNPNTAVPVNSGFLGFLNEAQKVTNALFPSGGSQPTLTITLKESKAVPDAVLTIDSQQQVTAGQTISLQWHSSPEGKIIFTTAQKPNTIATGPWSIFHFGLDYKRPTPTSVLPSVLSNGRSVETVPFEVGGPDAFMLDPLFMDKFHCVPIVAK